MNHILAYAQIAITAFLLYPIGRLLFKYLKIFIWYMFNSPVFWWDKYVEKPRLLFTSFGGLLVLASWLVFSNSNDIYVLSFRVNAYWEMLFAISLNIIGVSIFYSVWTKKFEEKLLPYIRKRIVGEDIKSHFENGYDIKNTLDQLVKLGYIECDLEAFQCLLSLKELPENVKIKTSFSKRDLIRFLFVIFDINKETKQDSIKEIVSYYFLDNNEHPYEISGVNSDISKVRGEILNGKKEFVDISQKMHTVFQSFKQRK